MLLAGKALFDHLPHHYHLVCILFLNGYTHLMVPLIICLPPHTILSILGCSQMTIL